MDEPVVDDCMNEKTEETAQKLGMTALELRALVKPLFFALYDHDRFSFKITRHGTKVIMEII